MVSSAEKRRRLAESKAKEVLNFSDSKALYSFPKSERFPKRMYRSVTDFGFYEIKPKLYNKNITFTSAGRADIVKRDGVPGPTRYSSLPNKLDKNKGIAFKSGREKCKANSVFQQNKNPGPFDYQPKYDMLFKTHYYTMAQRIPTKDKTEVPGPKYEISSTMLDQNKKLSIYIRRGSTRICPPRSSFPRKTNPTHTSRQNKLQSTTSQSFVTSKGGRELGNCGPYPRQSTEKRLFQKQIKVETPGPGQYQAFSEFVDDSVQAY